MYSMAAFARLAGVTVKMLRHYERIRLLTPKRTSAQHRRYSIRDLQSLERIIALRSLGLPLAGIKTLLKGGPVSLSAHRETLEDKRARLVRAINALEQLDKHPRVPETLTRFFGEAAWDRWEAMREKHAATTPRPPDRASESRIALFLEIVAAVAENPASERARDLVKRYRDTIEPETLEALRNRLNWPSGMRRYVASLYETTPEVWEQVVAFIEANEQSSFDGRRAIPLPPSRDDVT
jgi:DNA-binding transcriptional MerR regulator